MPMKPVRVAAHGFGQLPREWSLSVPFADPGNRCQFPSVFLSLLGNQPGRALKNSFCWQYVCEKSSGLDAQGSRLTIAKSTPKEN